MNNITICEVPMNECMFLQIKTNCKWKNLWVAQQITLPNEKKETKIFKKMVIKEVCSGCGHE